MVLFNRPKDEVNGGYEDMNNGVCMKDLITGKIVQLYENISFGEAFLKVSELRSKNDGNWYWIGKVSNHLLMK